MKNEMKENYLEKIPVRKDCLKWSVGEDLMVTLEVENKGFFNRVAQKLLKKPPVTYVHLDKLGSFIWPILDGNLDIASIGEKIKQQFGDEAEPLYERLIKFFQILESYNFITWNK